MTPIEPGRFTRAAIHNDAGEVELRLSAQGNWQLKMIVNCPSVGYKLWNGVELASAKSRAA